MRRWKCKVCGYIHEADEAPEKCPVCNADKIHFVEVDDKGDEIALISEIVVEVPVQEVKPKTFRDRLAALVLKLHLHPIAVHFPNGVLPVAVIFVALAILLGLATFKEAAFYNMVFVLLTMPLVMVTGYVEWQKRYKGAKTALFMTKIFCSLAVLICLLILVVWRLVDPTVADAGSVNRMIYLGISLAMLAAAGIAGHLGGKLVFGSRG
ncbi:MAG: DUF2231 domain-containing protein [Desulfobulbaceae bacterium]|nr:MAG: DUF2231 domain-containing protein [Desulfobulbaceae bacterium]